MNTKLEYTAHDLARHEIWRGEDLPPTLRTLVDDRVERSRDIHVKVGDLIAETCQVGFGGHYWEVLDSDTEGEALEALAEYLAPLYQMTSREAYNHLERARQEYCRRLEDAASEVRAKWAAQGHPVETANLGLGPKQPLDRCPACSRLIMDTDEIGCEDPSGQRWCINHALEALAWRRSKT